MANSLFSALPSLIGLSIVGNVIAWKQDIHKLAYTRLGKWMLIQANPFNLIVRTFGAVVLAYGIWLHAFLYILAGICMILLARIIP